MKLFLQSIDTEEIKRTAELGILGGVVLDPAHLPSLNQMEAIRGIAALTELVFCDVSGATAQEIIEDSSAFARASNKVGICLPIGTESMLATRHLKKAGIPVSIAGIRSVEQGWLAALTGVDYLSVNINVFGFDNLQSLLKMLDAQRLASHVAVSGFQEVCQVGQCAGLGVYAFITPPQLVAQILACQ